VFFWLLNSLVFFVMKWNRGWSPSHLKNVRVQVGLCFLEIHLKHLIYSKSKVVHISDNDTNMKYATEIFLPPAILTKNLANRK
jgi:hypothetical protein